MALYMVAEFDRIADVYDDTRPALNEAELGIIENTLKMCRSHSILEVGVGTGRVSKPLSEASFDIVGVDLSIRMISRAMQKGLRNPLRIPVNSTLFMNESSIWFITAKYVDAEYWLIQYRTSSHWKIAIDHGL